MDQSLVPADSIWTWKQADGCSLEVAWQCHADTPEQGQNSSVPAVVLVHGFGASGNHWRHNLPVLGKRTRTYALDLIGFGGSSAIFKRVSGAWRGASRQNRYGFNGAGACPAMGVDEPLSGMAKQPTTTTSQLVMVLACDGRRDFGQRAGSTGSGIA